MKKPNNRGATKPAPKASKPRPLPPIKFGVPLGSGGRDSYRLEPRKKGKLK